MLCIKAFFKEYEKSVLFYKLIQNYHIYKKKEKKSKTVSTFREREM